MTLRKMASILGSIRSCLPAVPFLRAFTDQMLVFVNRAPELGWDHKMLIPELIKEQLREYKQLMLEWDGRKFLDKLPSVTLHSDSSQWAWAGLKVNTQEIVQDFWREEASQHINWKELKAAIFTVQSFATPGDKIMLCVDNVVTFAYLSKS